MSVQQRARPPNVPSKNLLKAENEKLNEILGENCVSLATAVSQLLLGFDNQWRKLGCGVFCFVKDYSKRSFTLSLYDLKSRKSIFNHQVVASTRLEKSIDLFYTFDGENCKIGVNFVDQDEAQTFFHHFHRRQEAREARRMERNSVRGQFNSILNNLVNPEIKSSIEQKMKGFEKGSMITPKTSGFFTIGRGKKGNSRPEISSPLEGSYTHNGHVGMNNKFFKDPQLEKLFADVLRDMKITTGEKNYLTKVISNGDSAYNEFITRNKTTNENSSEKMPKGNLPNTKLTVTKCRPHQDIAMPTLIPLPTKTDVAKFQTPVIPSSTKSTAPPPPIPTRTQAVVPPPIPSRTPLTIPTPNSNVVSSPPLSPREPPPTSPKGRAPAPPVFSEPLSKPAEDPLPLATEPIRKAPAPIPPVLPGPPPKAQTPIPTESTSSIPVPPPLPVSFTFPPPQAPPLVNDPTKSPPPSSLEKSKEAPKLEQKDWLKDIENYNRENLTPVDSSSPKPSHAKSEPSIKTMEEFIKEMLEIRRKDLMGRDNAEEDDESDTDSDTEWNE